MPLLLLNEIQPYAWGSTTAISELLGIPNPDADPMAELWIGAHPRAPSRVELAGGRQSLERLIAAQPHDILGAHVADRFDQQLPFLMKVLAAAQPLSIQCHPDRSQAQAGFAREEAAGIARDAPHRNYKDDNHKPELLVALTPFTALKGFRPLEAIAKDFRSLGIDADWLRLGDDLECFFRSLMEAHEAELPPLLEHAGRAAASREPERFAAMRTLMIAYPGDRGALAPLFLNLVNLAPGEAIFLRARELHAYLEGTGIEIMASSDNVLRGGLTPKHIDVPELLATLRFEADETQPLTPEAVTPSEVVYRTAAPEFELSVVELDGAYAPAGQAGVEVLLMLDGDASVADLALSKGSSALIRADDLPYTIRGRGRIARARVGAFDAAAS